MIDIPLTIEKTQSSGTLQDVGIAFMQEKRLLKYRYLKQMINTRGSGEYVADVTFKEQQGSITVVNLSGEVRGTEIKFLLTTTKQ